MKPVMKIDVVVRITEDGLDALKKELKSARKPKISTIRHYFQDLVDEEMGRIIEKWDDHAFEHADREED